MNVFVLKRVDHSHPHKPERYLCVFETREKAEDAKQSLVEAWGPGQYTEFVILEEPLL